MKTYLSQKKFVVWSVLAIGAVVLAFPCLINAQRAGSDGWQLALPGWTYEFPRDHGAHPDFKTEWWYFTGNLTDSARREYGYEIAFFRQGIMPPKKFREFSTSAVPLSRFVQSDFKFAHFAVTDFHSGKFYCTQKNSRGAYGEAGFYKHASDETVHPTGADNYRFVWLEDWNLEQEQGGTWRISAQSKSPAISVELHVTPQKPPVIEGENGISQKAEGIGNASHYYSFTRLTTGGTLSTGDTSVKQKVSGESWFDHEWSSNQLGANQLGWDWFCFQFEDHTELMLYAMRRKDGSIDACSSGTWIAADGHAEHLKREEFSLSPTKRWRSSKTGVVYPLEWKIKIISHQIDLTVRAKLSEQELPLPGVTYWEGAILAAGTREGAPITGKGYMELTGYAGSLAGLQSNTPLPSQH